MTPQDPVLGHPRRQWTTLVWLLNAVTVLLLAIALRLVLYKQYPIQEDLLYSLLYLQAFLGAYVAMSLATLVRQMLKQQRTS